MANRLKSTFKFLVPAICFLTLQGQVLENKSGYRMFDVSLQNSNIEVFNLDNTKKIVLTFDDGPGRGTEQILNTLKKYRIKATFFALGQQIKKYPALTRRIVEEGHTLANHSYTHDRLTKDMYSQYPNLLLNELVSTHEELKKFIDPKINTFYFRAPYAAWLQNASQLLNENSDIKKYIGPICWDIGRNIEYRGDQIMSAADWECWSSKVQLEVSQCALGYMRKIDEFRGGVVLMHDIHTKTADMVDLLIPALLAQGYEFIDLPQIQSLNEYKNVRSQIPKHEEKSAYSMYQGRCSQTRAARPTAL